MRTVSKDQNDEHRYDDILTLPHHVSINHPQMSKEQRAAQFSPFSALTGYEESIAEAGRTTAEMIDLSEEEKAIIDKQLHFLQENIQSHPAVILTYFQQDSFKEGGSYNQITQKVKKIDEGKLFLEKQVIDFEQIISMQIKTD